MRKEQRRYFPPYDAAYKKAQIKFAFGIVGRIAAIVACGWFFIAVANGNIKPVTLIVLLLALCTFGAAIKLFDQIIDQIRYFSLHVTSEAFKADPRARAAHEEGCKASFSPKVANAGSLESQIAYDTAIAKFVEDNPSFHYGGDKLSEKG